MIPGYLEPIAMLATFCLPLIVNAVRSADRYNDVMHSETKTRPQTSRQEAAQ